jgi:hypothetical protein
MNKENLVVAIRSVLAQLEKHELDLFRLRAGERAITSKIAAYLDSMDAVRSGGWRADAEYGKVMKGGKIDPKRLLMQMPACILLESDGAHRQILSRELAKGERLTYPDVIIHRRGKSDNLVAIEVKLESGIRERSVESDVRKLIGYCLQLGYQYGVFMSLAYRRNHPESEGGVAECLEADLLIFERIEGQLVNLRVTPILIRGGLGRNSEEGRGLRYAIAAIKNQRSRLYAKTEQ